MNIDPNTTKYLIRATINADGIVDKPDIIGAIFGQTEGLLGDELDLRDLQKSGRLGRLEVEINTHKGRTEGKVAIPSSLDQVETSIFAASLETVERVGPCKASMKVDSLEDIRVAKRQQIIDRAKTLLSDILSDSRSAGANITDSVRQVLQTEEITTFGASRSPAGPNVASSDAIIVVEGRSDVLNLLRYGIKNAVAVEGTSIPKEIQDLTRERTVTAFVDGDRGGELVLRELLDSCEVDFVARAPQSREVEDLTQKQIMKCLRDKMPKDQFLELTHFGTAKDNNRGRGSKSTSRKGKGSAKAKSEPKAKAASKTMKETKAKTPAKTGSKTAEKAKPKEKESAPPKEKKQTKAPAKAAPAKEKAEPSGIEWELAGKYRSMLKELDKTRKARLLDEKNKTVKEVAISALTETLQSVTQPIKAVVFDGIITQRLIDIATEKSISTLVAVRTGPITKRPVGIKLFDKNQL